MEVHRLSGVDLAHLAGPADAAAAIVVRHVSGGQELLDEAANGIRVGTHPALLDHHIAFLVELARYHVGQTAALQPRPQLQTVFRHRPEVDRLIQRGFGVQALGSVALGHVGELVGDDEFVRLGFGLLESLLQLDQLLLVAAHGLQVLGLVGVVGRLHLCQRNLLGGVVFGADLAGSFEGQVLEHMRQAALARGVVHVARVDKCGVAEDRRLRPLADDQRQPVGQHLGGDSLLEALEVLRASARQGQNCQHQRPSALVKPGDFNPLHPISLPEGRKRAPPYSSKLVPWTEGGQTGSPSRNLHSPLVR